MPLVTTKEMFRKAYEGGYAIGSYGVNITDDLAVDFTVATREGCERIARLAYDYAQKNHKGKVSIITKANIIKTTDGKFLKTAQMIGQEYPDRRLVYRYHHRQADRPHAPQGL